MVGEAAQAFGKIGQLKTPSSDRATPHEKHRANRFRPIDRLARTVNGFPKRDKASAP
jgi:hypothetical protein